jgi:hypothetical protein
VRACVCGPLQYTFPGLGLALVELLPRRFAPAHTARMARAAEALRDKLADLLGPDGVLVLPTHPTVAPVHWMPLCVAWAWSAPRGGWGLCLLRVCVVPH